MDRLAVIPFCEVCGDLRRRRVVCGGRGVPEEEQRWSLFERQLHQIYIILILNKSCPCQQKTSVGLCDPPVTIIINVLINV